MVYICSIKKKVMKLRKAVIAEKEIEYKYTIWRYIAFILLNKNIVYFTKWILRLFRNVPTHYVYEKGELIKIYTLSELGIK